MFSILVFSKLGLFIKGKNIFTSLKWSSLEKGNKLAPKIFNNIGLGVHIIKLSNL